MNREVREVRPYQVNPLLSQVLKDAELIFGSDRCVSGSRIEVQDTEHFRRCRAELIWTSSDSMSEFRKSVVQGCEDSGISLENVNLVVTASSSFLKKTETIFEQSLSNINQIPAEVVLSDPRPAVLHTGYHPIEINVYLLLNEKLPPRPLRPWRKGTWLARAKFRLSSKSSFTPYRLQRLTDDERDRLNLPKGATRYVEFDGYNPLSNQDEVTPIFWVDAELLDILDANSALKASEVIQIQLIQDFIWSVLSSPDIQQNNDLSNTVWSDIQGSLFGRIIHLAAGQDRTPERRNQLIRMAHSDLPRFMAHVEDAIGIGKSMRYSLGDST
ncbi:MAG: hypothetical protein OXH10_09450 [bacterium]|nr:hypothetical protein [bacterium]MDE0644349.1 hypothetical protein [bacterium]MYH55893.1 hypothetical protein [Acidimicrobiia bacterium]